MNKKKALLALLFGLMTLMTTVMGAVPAELNCTPFADEENSFCTDLDQIGTGIGLMAFKINKGLPAFLLGLGIIAGILGLLGAVIVLIKKALSSGSKKF